jgi:NADH-quinone oxidoreductase subunit N
LKLGGLDTPAGWLTLLAIAMSAVGLYYYLLILKQALVAGPSRSAESRIGVPLPAAVALAVTTFLLIVLGVFPSVVLRLLP